MKEKNNENEVLKIENEGLDIEREEENKGIGMEIVIDSAER